jgi:hypothetical protein
MLDVRTPDVRSADAARAGRAMADRADVRALEEQRDAFTTRLATLRQCLSEAEARRGLLVRLSRCGEAEATRALATLHDELESSQRQVSDLVSALADLGSELDEAKALVEQEHLVVRRREALALAERAVVTSQKIDSLLRKLGSEVTALKETRAELASYRGIHTVAPGSEDPDYPFGCAVLAASPMLSKVLDVRPISAVPLARFESEQWTVHGLPVGVSTSEKRPHVARPTRPDPSSHPRELE